MKKVAVLRIRPQYIKAAPLSRTPCMRSVVRERAQACSTAIWFQ